MKKTSIIVIVIAALAVLIGIAVAAGTNPIKNTSWKTDISVVRFGDTDFEWESANALRKGTYTVYKGKQAKKIIDDYVAECNKAEDVPDSEKNGFASEVDELKKDMTGSSFVIAEKVDSMTYKGKDIKYADSVYIGRKSRKELTLIDVKTRRTIKMDACEKDAKPEADPHKSDFDEVKSIDDNITSDKNIPFTYKAMDNSKKTISSDSAVRYEDPENYVHVTIMKDVPVNGIVDDFAVREKTPINEIDGYLVTDSIGASVEYLYAFDLNGDTVFIQSDDEDFLKAFVKSIKL